MNYETMTQNAEQIIEKRRKRSAWQKVVTVLACLVVFCTTYALILPAITSENEPLCGVESHKHQQECYEQISAQAKILACTAESLGIHVHSSECFDGQGNATCGQADFVVHCHDDRCLDADGNLVCTLPDVGAHTHTDSCYKTTEAVTTIHTHDDACYTQSKGDLICELALQEAHTHEESCYAESLVCTLTEEHTHEAACYEKTLQCTLEETQGHEHTDECYAWTQELACGLEEGAEVITEPAQQVLICAFTKMHAHTEACFRVEETEPTCGQEHEHSELCYGTWVLKCELEEHTHGSNCFVDRTADVESAQEWELSFSHVNLTGNRAEDLLAIARTQLGYEESTKNYFVESNGVVKGYTRYGQWYGDCYGDWCAMFVSFCLHYADVQGVPLHAACTPWIEELKKQELYAEAENYIPYPGDIIFYDWEGDGLSDHVGLVAEVLEETGSSPMRVKALEGNSSNRVQYVTYNLEDARIVGYGKLPVNRFDPHACGLDEHQHEDACFDENEQLLCEISEHTHSEACMRYTLVYADDQMRVSTVIEGQALPEDITLSVMPLEQQSQAYDAALTTVSEEIANDSNYIGGICFYQMQLMSENEIYELPQQTMLDMNVYFADPVFTAEQIEESTNRYTFLLTEEEVGTTETVETEESETTEGTEAEEEIFDDGKTTSDDLGGVRDEIETQLIEVPATEQVPTEDDEVEEEIHEEELPTIEPEQDYLLQATEDEQYKNFDMGITGLNFRTEKLGVVAMALTTHTQTGTFWTRVSSTSELNKNDTYLIVSAEGNYALVGNNSNNYKAVTISCVKGWEQYYTISDSDDTDLHWKFNSTGSSYTLKNVGTSRWLALSASSTVIATSSKSLKFTYQSAEKCWRIANGNYFLRNTGTGSFSRSNSSDGSYNSSTTYYYSRDMLIFKLAEDVTSLEITDDLVTNSTPSGDAATAPDKPDYDEFVTPSGGKTGETAVVDENDATVSVPGQYFSDPATSNIESEFRCNTFEEHKLNDGKVLTDKSVIYGDDDYGVFDTYDANTFGVTLSALAQEYEIPYQDTVRTPIDVVFILDTSGSMATDASDGSAENGRDSSRASALTVAANAAIKQILEDHPANRIGIVLYSSGAWEMLPLDRYTANNDEYLVCAEKTVTFSPTNYKPAVQFVSGSSSLKNEAGVSFANAGSSSYQGLGTYTQAGIAMGNKVFEDIGDDTTYTTVIGEGEYQRTYTVNRQPVFILLSDGEPTHSTNIYMDPLSGPHYGDGNGGTENAMGIHGYNTILSANYFKRKVSIQYEKQAMFYTIGMGINTPEQGDGPQVSTSNTGDNYKRAVLDPTVENIQNLTSNKNASITTTQLKNMLFSNYSSHAVQVRSDWPDSWTGVPHRYTPVLQANPYENDFSYADKAYFGKLSSADLKEIFSQIITSSLKTTPYGFTLHRNSSIELVDNIGVGMEVKGTPILRYNGVNYTNPTITVNGNVTTYVYNETFVDPHIPNRATDLSQISITITTDADGNQTVKMFVPDDIMPTYTPELIGREYYYESLPLRLVYQVGLTEASQQDVLNLLKDGGQLVYYTNRWDEDGKIATSTLTPSTTNPYYYDTDGNGAIQYHKHSTEKDENLTESYSYVVNCSPTTDATDTDVLKIVHRLGNNGKLVFSADSIKIDVEKSWAGINSSIMNPINLTLYKVKETVDGNGMTRADAEPVKVITISFNERWQGTFEGIPAPEDPWYYAIAEAVPTGYQVTYGGETVMISVDNGAPFMAAKVEITEEGPQKVFMTNSTLVDIPITGGIGTYVYTAGGLLLICSAGALLLYRTRKHRRKEDIVSS